MEQYTHKTLSVHSQHGNREGAQKTGKTVRRKKRSNKNHKRSQRTKTFEKTDKRTTTDEKERNKSKNKQKAYKVTQNLYYKEK